MGSEQETDIGAHLWDHARNWAHLPPYGTHRGLLVLGREHIFVFQERNFCGVKMA